MMIADALRFGAQLLAEAAIPEHSKEAASLLGFVIGRDRAYLIAHDDLQLGAKEIERFEAVLRRRASHEPFQYIVGKQEFFGLEFKVTPDVLIPRPETEILVEHAIDWLNRREARRFCEIGIGSGCISLAILANVPDSTCIAGDVSENALLVAVENALRLGLQQRIKIVLSDIFASMDERGLDLIVTNPPYVALKDIGGLQIEVREHEPLVALTDRGNGLGIIRRIIHDSAERLAPGGRLLMEIGWDQSEPVQAMLLPEVWQRIDLIPDLQGIPRVVSAIKTSD
ncbi:peptide chain release factor N(5)-glutamine methyltransferase [Leptolyngbya sp. 7M]|uniref:peptide chain release factor N(5)-glutamine methyltransferase n=1 Tax=Leptolyngbya sp. 7M TaxID=2812896 RepID=UPI001B8D654B|nr:peptide chain release factor N(5)-glutamine methyltransferase [Leptolyngbya sp. 7M]QYO66377.1 peptide chain release factor N(5)-glutamine methyltransferase [Leptolyngbya sp. 7M]